jgi:hypothetical protein
MAQDIGLLLRGLGAAVSNQVPQFRQQMMADQENQMRQQEFQAQQDLRGRQIAGEQYDMAEKIRIAGGQDAFALTNLLDPKNMNLEAAMGLVEDRLGSIELAEKQGIRMQGDPTRAIYADMQKALLGDTAALQRVRNVAGVYTAQAVARGDVKLPEVQRDKGVVVNGRVVNPYSGDVIAEFPNDAATFRLLTAAEVQQQGLEPGNYQINERTKQVSRIGAPSTVVNVGQATESERTAGILANRLDYAQTQIKDILATAPEAEKPAAGATALNTLGLEYLARVANPAERQIIEAAQMDMLDAALTLGTGAAYTREQLEGYRTSYFPQLGDDPRTINAKSQRLNNLVSAAYDKAGRAAPTERRGAESQAPQDWIAAGLDQADWNALSEDDKKAYLESN